MNEIVETFGFGQIELAVLERAAGKFAGLGRAHVFERGQRGEQRRQHRAAAMDMKFRDILAGRACRTRKPQHHSIINSLLRSISQHGERVAIRGGGSLSGDGLKAIAPACAPDTRTMAMA